MADKELVIKIDENEYNNLIKRAHENIHALSHVDKMILHSTPLEEELYREKEQAYYLGYEAGKKSEWTAVAESEDR